MGCDETTNKRPEPVDGACTRTVSSIDLELIARLFDHAPDVAFFVKNALGQYLAINRN
jgi:hypothetical protein